MTDYCKYLGIHFVVGKGRSFDITPVRRKFLVASNSIIAQTHGLAATVWVQLIESFCLHVLVYCFGALKLKPSMIQELTVCWNNVIEVVYVLRNGRPFGLQAFSWWREERLLRRKASCLLWRCWRKWLIQDFKQQERYRFT